VAAISSVCFSCKALNVSSNVELMSCRFLNISIKFSCIRCIARNA
jgi:hypothetical protein